MDDDGDNDSNNKINHNKVRCISSNIYLGLYVETVLIETVTCCWPVAIIDIDKTTLLLVIMSKV